MQNSGTREGETLKPLVEPVPREPSLAPPSKGAEPGAMDFTVEAVQRVPVARERVVPIVPAKYTAEPRMLQRQRRVHTSSLFVTHGVQFAGDPSLVCPSLHDEASLSAWRAVMRKAEEGKRLGPPVIARLSSFGGKPAEFEKARFLFVEHQAERSKALPKVDHHLPRVRLVLEAHHEVAAHSLKWSAMRDAASRRGARFAS